MFTKNQSNIFYNDGLMGLGTVSPMARLDIEESGSRVGIKVTQKGTASSRVGIEASATGIHGTAMRGVATHPQGGGWGVHGESRGTVGRGVYGLVTGTRGSHGVFGHSRGAGDGVGGQSDGSDGRGVHGVAANTTGRGTGVLGETFSNLGAGVHGRGRGTRGAPGVLGESEANNGVGVVGRAAGNSAVGVYGSSSGQSILASGVSGTAFGPLAPGVFGLTNGTNGTGVLGRALDDAGEVYGVRGLSSSPRGTGVFGRDTSTIGLTVGVRGESLGHAGRGVYGLALGATGNITMGVFGSSTAPFGRGVYGFGLGSRGVGVYGIVTTSQGIAVLASGNSRTTGSKSFTQPHPTDPSRTVQFICLEGNESGTYFRGSMRLMNGRAEIRIPMEWQEVTAAAGITVQLTPIGPAQVWLESQARNKIVVRGTPDCRFNYFVNGVRRGFTKYEPYEENRSFRPTVRGVPFGTQYPEDLRDILVRSGVLNQDYTPNERTAQQLGWKLDDPETVPLAERYWLPGAERERLLAEQRAADRRLWAADPTRSTGQDR